MTRGLGLDAGGSGTRWVLADAAGAPMARGEGPPLSGHVFSDAARERAREAVAALAEAVLPQGRPEALVAGVTGTSADSPEAAIVTALLSDAFGIPPDRVRVADDLSIAHRARFAAGEGILVYAGTGSAACHVDARGAAVRAGGWGHLIDDAGSGQAIARDALRAVLRAEDARPGAGWAGMLGRALAGAIGGAAWPVVRAHVYGGVQLPGGDRARLAALAPCVAAAARAGDPAALAVLAQAGRDLARLAEALRGRVGPQPVALAGNAALLHEAIRDAMRDELGMDVATERIDAAAAAARIAAEMP